jgi:hypothetical protein
MLFCFRGEVMASESNFYLYLLGARYYSQRKSWHYVKIGHTNNIKRRFSAIDAASPMTVKVIGLIKCSSKAKILELENRFKNDFKGFKVKREWFHYEDTLLATFKGFTNE